MHWPQLLRQDVQAEGVQQLLLGPAHVGHEVHVGLAKNAAALTHFTFLDKVLETSDGMIGCHCQGLVPLSDTFILHTSQMDPKAIEIEIQG